MENKGFTLIELLIVITIIGILVGIALPSYQAHVRKANRIDAQLEMSEMSLAAEREYARNGTYTAVSAYIDKSYQFDLTKNGPAKFTITALPQGGQGGDECGTMTLDQKGTLTVSSSTVEDCW
ncbi:MAG: type IV pilin protein [Psychromonas sp.]|nr:type IV pilin protein [Alteromonadales bacterium]MCP5078151.1 type IV pilin protein [Psychromonas sp.]